MAGLSRLGQMIQVPATSAAPPRLTTTTVRRRNWRAEWGESVERWTSEGMVAFTNVADTELTILTRCSGT